MAKSLGESSGTWHAGRDTLRDAARNETGGCETKPSKQTTMKTPTQEDIDSLAHLIEICADGVRGYEAASREVDDAELRQLFDEYARQRSSMRHELELCVSTLGGEPDAADSVAGRVHRGWMKVRGAVANRESHAILAECERGEDAAVQAYREAMDQLVTPDVREIVARQYVRVKSAHDRVRELRDSPVYSNR
jgi:uncharacterized protein (TIGR02284 family)